MITNSTPPAPVAARIRELRLTRGWTLAELARRTGTSAPALHRYESGWDRFSLPTLRKIATALGARLEIRLVEEATARDARRVSSERLVELISPLFWDTDLSAETLQRFPDWALARVLTSGDMRQVAAARRFFGDEVVLSAVTRRDVDARTRNYWTLVLEEERDAP